jgi:hypothetical protein
MPHTGHRHLEQDTPGPSSHPGDTAVIALDTTFTEMCLSGDHTTAMRGRNPTTTHPTGQCCCARGVTTYTCLTADHSAFEPNNFISVL